MLTFHAIAEMTADGLTEDDVQALFLNGSIVRRERDLAGRTKYTVEGQTESGGQTRAICRFSDSGQQIVVITVYALEEE